MKNARKLVATALLGAFMISLAGCGSQGQGTGNQQGEEKPKQEEVVKNTALDDAEAKLLEALAPLPKKDTKAKLAALEITLANPFWVTMKEGYEAAASEYGVSMDVLAAPKEDDVNSQLETLKTLLNKDYKAIAISAMTPFNLVPGVAEATKKGIPVVAVGTSIDAAEAEKAKAKIEAFITSDFEEQGKMGAEFIASKIGSGKVAIIGGLPGAAQGEARVSGAQKGFAANKEIEIVGVQPGNWDRQTAYNITRSLLQANPELKGIFCANDVMALGAVEALKAADKKKDVVVVGVDFIEEAKDSISKGELDATVAMSPYLFGKGGLILTLKAIEGHEIKQDIFWTPLGLVQKDNLDSFEGWR